MEVRRPLKSNPFPELFLDYFLVATFNYMLLFPVHFANLGCLH